MSMQTFIIIFIVTTPGGLGPSSKLFSSRSPTRQAFLLMDNDRFEITMSIQLSHLGLPRILISSLSVVELEVNELLIFVLEMFPVKFIMLSFMC